jgi:hypothetical protein
MYRLHIFMGVSHLYMYEMNYISIWESYSWTDEFRSPTQEHLIRTLKVE